MARMRWNPSNGADLFALINQLAERVDHLQITGGNYEEWLHDVGDHPIMATAIVDLVDYLVTANTKDFPPKKRFANITIITPDTFLNRLQAQP